RHHQPGAIVGGPGEGRASCRTARDVLRGICRRTQPAGLEGSRDATRADSIAGEIEMNAPMSASPPCSSFNIEDMQWRGPLAAIVKWLVDEPQGWMTAPMDSGRIAAQWQSVVRAVPSGEDTGRG